MKSPSTQNQTNILAHFSETTMFFFSSLILIIFTRFFLISHSCSGKVCEMNQILEVKNSSELNLFRYFHCQLLWSWLLCLERTVFFLKRKLLFEDSHDFRNNKDNPLIPHLMQFLAFIRVMIKLPEDSLIIWDYCNHELLLFWLFFCSQKKSTNYFSF